MSIISDVQKLNPGALVDLFELDLTTIGINTKFRFHNMTGVTTDSVWWQGLEYIAFPIEATGFEVQGDKQLPRPIVRVANVTGMISSMLKEMNDLVGAKVVRRRTFSKYLDPINFPGGVNPTADSAQHIRDEIWFIDRKAAETNTVVEFELCVPWDLEGAVIPKRPCTPSVCVWTYRGDGCMYAGGPVAKVDNTPTSNPNLDECSRSLTGCKLRFGNNAQLPIGIFPAVGIIR